MFDILYDKKAIEMVNYLIGNYSLKEIFNIIHLLDTQRERNELIEEQIIDDFWNNANDDDEDSGFYFDL